MKVISYSLFGYGKDRHASCFDFGSYLRGLMINIRIARLLYKGWVIRVHLDNTTYEGFKEFWDNLKNIGVQIRVLPSEPLTKAMLWRMLPAFDGEVEMFICRDTDSPLTYRERQAVYEWEQSPKVAHAITDSISHGVPMLGGMIGFKVRHFKEYTGFESWNEMCDKERNYEQKGKDQDLLTYHVYPKFAGTNHSIMQHYFLGYRNTFIDGFKTCNCRQDDGTYHKEGCVLDIEMDGISKELNVTNDFAGHIGAAGWYEPVIFKVFKDYLNEFDDIREAEKPIANILNWSI
jgi:hypothetical protein